MECDPRERARERLGGREDQSVSRSMELSTIFHPNLDAGVVLHAYFANAAKVFKCTGGRCLRGHHSLLLELK